MWQWGVGSTPVPGDAPPACGVCAAVGAGMAAGADASLAAPGPARAKGFCWRWQEGRGGRLPRVLIPALGLGGTLHPPLSGASAI